MTTWNEALEAYDADCEALEEVRGEYESYLRSVFDGVSEKVVERSGETWRGKYDDENGPALGWYAQPRRVGLHAWNARPYGGPPRTLLVGLVLDVRAGFSPKDGARRRRLFLDAVKEGVDIVTMLGPDSERHGEVSDDVVLVSSTPIAPNARVQLAEQAVALSDLALKLDELVEQCAWLAA